MYTQQPQYQQPQYQQQPPHYQQHQQQPYQQQPATFFSEQQVAEALIAYLDGQYHRQDPLVQYGIGTLADNNWRNRSFEYAIGRVMQMCDMVINGKGRAPNDALAIAVPLTADFMCIDQAIQNTNFINSLDPTQRQRIDENLNMANQVKNDINLYDQGQLRPNTQYQQQPPQYQQQPYQQPQQQHGGYQHHTHNTTNDIMQQSAHRSQVPPSRLGDQQQSQIHQPQNQKPHELLRMRDNSGFYGTANNRERDPAPVQQPQPQPQPAEVNKPKKIDLNRRDHHGFVFNPHVEYAPRVPGTTPMEYEDHKKLFMKKMSATEEEAAKMAKFIGSLHDNHKYGIKPKFVEVDLDKVKQNKEDDIVSESTEQLEFAPSVHPVSNVNEAAIEALSEVGAAGIDYMSPVGFNYYEVNTLFNFASTSDKALALANADLPGMLHGVDTINQAMKLFADGGEDKIQNKVLRVLDTYVTTLTNNYLHHVMDLNEVYIDSLLEDHLDLLAMAKQQNWVLYTESVANFIWKLGRKMILDGLSMDVEDEWPEESDDDNDESAESTESTTVVTAKLKAGIAVNGPSESLGVTLRNKSILVTSESHPELVDILVANSQYNEEKGMMVDGTVMVFDNSQQVTVYRRVDGFMLVPMTH